MASLKELLEMRADIERRIAETQREERAAAIEQIRDLMGQYGLTAADIAGRAPAPPKRAGAKVAAKYRDPETGQTWSGRGLQPNWLKKALSNGKKLGDFGV
jgi:DNA-binding protein H-NS